MPVRLLTRADDTAYLALRLEALEREPLVFPHSLENEQAITSEARAARLTALEKLMLGVATTQTGARTLYCSLGFEPFGLERHAWKVDTRYVDEEYFVLWLER